jgi:hypothetical protein
MSFHGPLFRDRMCLATPSLPLGPFLAGEDPSSSPANDHPRRPPGDAAGQLLAPALQRQRAKRSVIASLSRPPREKLAERVGIHVSQLRRYEGEGPSPPLTSCAGSLCAIGER